MALFHIINNYSDYKKLGDILRDTYSISIDKIKYPIQSDNIIEDIWDLCLEKCNKFLYPLTPVNKEFLALLKNNEYYLKVIKEHVIFSSYYTYLNLINKNRKVCINATTFNKKYVGEYNVPEIVNRNLVNQNADCKNSNYRKLRRNIEQLKEVDYIADIFGIRKDFKVNVNCIFDYAANLLYDLIEIWAECPYNLKFLNGRRFSINNYIELQDFFKKNKKNYNTMTQFYLLERVLNFSFTNRLLDILNNFSEFDSNYYSIPRDLSDLYIDKDLNYTNLFDEKIQICTCEYKYIDRRILGIRDIQDIRIHKSDFQNFANSLAGFAALPNIFSRNRFIVFAINLYFHCYNSSIITWREDLKIFIDMLTIYTFPVFEGCFLYMLIEYSNPCDGIIKVKFITDKLRKYISNNIKNYSGEIQHKSLNKVDENESNALLYNDENLLSGIYHDIMRQVSQNSKLYNLISKNTSAQEAIKEFVHITSME